MKRCGRCGTVKGLDEFHRSRRDGHQLWCKDCRREYDRLYHAANQALRVEQARRRQRKLYDLSTRMKMEGRCADCGGRFHPAAMHWDHFSGNKKKYEISNLVKRGCTRMFRE